MQHALYNVSLGIFRLFLHDIPAGNAVTEATTSNTYADAAEVRAKHQEWTRKTSLTRHGYAPMLKGMEVL